MMYFFQNASKSDLNLVRLGPPHSPSAILGFLYVFSRLIKFIKIYVAYISLEKISVSNLMRIALKFKRNVRKKGKLIRHCSLQDLSIYWLNTVQ